MAYKHDPEVIPIIIIYLLVFAFAYFMAVRVEKNRIGDKHEHEAFWHQARE